MLPINSFVGRARVERDMRVSVASHLVQRTWQDSDGNKHQTVEIEIGHVGPDLQFATAEVSEASSQEDA